MGEGGGRGGAAGEKDEVAISRMPSASKTA